MSAQSLHDQIGEKYTPKPYTPPINPREFAEQVLEVATSKQSRQTPTSLVEYVTFMVRSRDVLLNASLT